MINLFVIQHSFPVHFIFKSNFTQFKTYACVASSRNPSKQSATDETKNVSMYITWRCSLQYPSFPTSTSSSEDGVLLPTWRGHWKRSHTQSSHPMDCICTCTCTGVGAHTGWPSECSAEECNNNKMKTMPHFQSPQHPHWDQWTIKQSSFGGTWWLYW